MIEIKTEKGDTCIDMSGNTTEIGTDCICIVLGMLKTAIDDGDVTLFNVLVNGIGIALNVSLNEWRKK